MNFFSFLNGNKSEGGYFNSYTEDYKTTSKLLIGKKLPLRQINDGTESQFEFKFINRKLYVVNDNYRILCSIPLKGRLLIDIFYIPKKGEYIYIDESYYDGREVQICLDVIFYVDHIKSLKYNLQLEFLDNFFDFIIRNRKDDVFMNRLIYECNFNVRTQHKLYLKYNSIGIISTLLIYHNFKEDLNLKRLFNSISNIENDSFDFKFMFSKNTYKIESKQLFFDYFFKKYPNVDSLMGLFEINYFRENLSEILMISDDTSFELVNKIEKNVSTRTKLKGGLLNNNLSLKDRSIKYLSTKEKKPYVFVFDYSQKIRDKLRTIENEYRIEKGHNIVGSMINESILFQKIKEHFSDYKVISQGSPKWLKRQRIDIYFPSLNIGIEYQGDQHFRPIDYFGGEEGFILTQERDKRKRNLCKRNGCVLIDVLPNYNLKEVIKEVESHIKTQ